MAKHNKGEGQTAVMDEVAAEQPKTKVGDQTETTTIDAASGEKKPRGSAIRETGSFRILDGVDITKFNGQRKAVVAALQKLANNEGADKSFTIGQIVSNIEGLVAKAGVEASALWHLKGLIANKQVEYTAPVKAEAAPAADATPVA